MLEAWFAFEDWLRQALLFLVFAAVACFFWVMIALVARSRDERASLARQIAANGIYRSVVFGSLFIGSVGFFTLLALSVLGWEPELPGLSLKAWQAFGLLALFGTIFSFFTDFK